MAGIVRAANLVQKRPGELDFRMIVDRPVLQSLEAADRAAELFTGFHIRNREIQRLLHDTQHFRRRGDQQSIIKVRCQGLSLFGSGDEPVIRHDRRLRQGKRPVTAAIDGFDRGGADAKQIARHEDHDGSIGRAGIDQIGIGGGSQWHGGAYPRQLIAVMIMHGGNFFAHRLRRRRILQRRDDDLVTGYQPRQNLRRTGRGTAGADRIGTDGGSGDRFGHQAAAGLLQHQGKLIETEPQATVAFRHHHRNPAGVGHCLLPRAVKSGFGFAQGTVSVGTTEARHQLFGAFLQQPLFIVEYEFHGASLMSLRPPCLNSGINPS